MTTWILRCPKHFLVKMESVKPEAEVAQDRLSEIVAKWKRRNEWTEQGKRRKETR
jgi:hypothetical protein